jgi:hypothetical protein
VAEPIVLVLLVLLLRRWFSLAIALPVRAIADELRGVRGGGTALMPIELLAGGAICAIVLMYPNASLWAGNINSVLLALGAIHLLAYLPLFLVLVWVSRRRRLKQNTDAHCAEDTRSGSSP